MKTCSSFRLLRLSSRQDVRKLRTIHLRKENTFQTECACFQWSTKTTSPSQLKANRSLINRDSAKFTTCLSKCAKWSALSHLALNLVHSALFSSADKTLHSTTQSLKVVLRDPQIHYIEFLRKLRTFLHLLLQITPCVSRIQCKSEEIRDYSVEHPDSSPSLSIEKQSQGVGSVRSESARTNK